MPQALACQAKPSLEEDEKVGADLLSEFGKMLSAVQSMAVQLSSMAGSEMFVRLPVEGRPARALLRSSRKRPGKYLNHIGRT